MQLEPMLRILLEDPYPEKEIVVCIDEPTQASERLVASLEEKVRFFVSRERKGKVAALNTAVKETNSDILLFLDSDLELHQQGFLSLVADEMNRFDIIEIKKKIIRDSFIARIVNYDYLSANFANLLFSRYLGQCLGINGAAFAIRREAMGKIGGFDREICEDLGIAMKAYLKRLRFGYAEGIEVHNKVDSSWKVWFKQRKRWGIGLGLWLRRYYKQLIGSIIKHPIVVLSALLIIFPSLPLIMTIFAVPDHFYVSVVSFILLFLASKQLLVVPPMTAFLIGVAFTQFLTMSLIFFAGFAIIFYYFSKRLGYAFNLLEFVFFFYVYNPLWLLISIASFLRVLIWRNGFNLDWKV